VSVDLRVRRRARLGAWPTLAIWAALVLLTWLDADRCLAANQAAVFGVIWAAIGAIGSLLGAVGGAIAASLESVVVFLAHSLGWLAGHVADLLHNTGAMFAKVWDAAKIVYDDVLKPVAQWLHDMFNTVKDWLKRVFSPILEWANRVKAELVSLFNRFLKPVWDALDTAKHILDMLAKLHIPFAQQLDAFVTDLEKVLQENYLWLLGEVNKVIDTINGIVTLDGFFQRFVFLRTLQRDAFYVWRVLGNHGARATTDDDRYKVSRATVVRTVPEVTDDMGKYLRGEDANITPILDEAINRARDYLTAA